MNESSSSSEHVDWAALRLRFASLRGKEYWRSLEELADRPEFRESLSQEFPRQAQMFSEPMDRREFVTLLGAALALAGFSGCGRPPAEKIIPYARQPETIVPGKSLSYATAMPLADGALGLLVRSDSGRPTKVEGNPRHPASLGATDVFAQAAIYGLWDPDRSQTVLHAGVPATWPEFLEALASVLRGLRNKRGAGLAILTEGVVSPTVAAELEGILRALPEARWNFYDPIGREEIRAGSQIAFGSEVDPLYRFGAADIVVSLDADFLTSGPGHVRYAHDFTLRRRADRSPQGMNRLYVVEPTLTATGSMADHRWPVSARQIESVAHALAAALGLRRESPVGTLSWTWISAVARDLKAHRGRSVVIAGPRQPSSVHALAIAINQELGNLGKTVSFIDPITAPGGSGMESLRDLTVRMADNRVEALLILGGNPVYAAPPDLEFEKALSRVPFRAHLGLYSDETAWLCHWHVPEAHFLETWGDALAFDGTASIVQPVIAPLYDGKSPLDILTAVLGEVGRRPYDLVREYWGRHASAGRFEDFWVTALEEGILPGTSRPGRTPVANAPPAGAPTREPHGLEILYRPDPSVWDGRYANNAWLQELPKPFTELTWDNAALVSPAMAGRLKLSSGDVVELSIRGQRLLAPVWVAPGHADQSVSLSLGYGRRRAGRVGNGVGVNANLLRSAGRSWIDDGLELRKTGATIRLASTQLHHLMESRHPIRATTASELARNPEAGRGGEGEARPSLYPETKGGEYAWGMVIDLSSCTHCNACVLACQVENNVPVVGKGQVLKSREMHWLRIDTYFEGPPDQPRAYPQPVPCMHCENAPCELVCPVNATTHSKEGLNQMVYNRCVGTRYCSNNCPYKVRRFNFLQYADFATPSFQEMYNPDVTVRERGVMEKCTYCVQRLTHARIDAEREGRRIRDGEVRTACQQACPNGAIVFGDLSDRQSQVSRLRSDPLQYELLGELNTRPRTTYLAKVRNPNPELEGT